MAVERTTSQDNGRPVTTLTWDDIRAALVPIDIPGAKVYGVPRGGLCAAAVLRRAEVVTSPDEANIILDDIVDSGATRSRFLLAYPGVEFVALIDKTDPDCTGLGWVVFPWENETGPEDAVVRLLEYVGEDPNRDGLVDTPARVVKALGELTEGYSQDPGDILSTTFEADCDEMVIVQGIEFHSLCEHHMLPFHGKATVAYVPRDRVVGLSKIPRLVNAFSRRLQLQERLTRQIVDAMMEHLDPVGAACLIRAHHSCQSMRGVRSPAKMVTSALAGVIFDDDRSRSEFMSLASRSVE